MKCCENCAFAVAIFYDKDTLQKRLEEIEISLQPKQKNKLLEWLGDDLSVSEEIKRFDMLDEKRNIQIKLIEMEEDVICRRYPTPRQSYKKYWCGEYMEKV